MLDLNLNFVNEDDTAAFRDVEESGTSNSSVVNADACISTNADAGDGDVEEDSSSAAAAGESFSCFNFDILKGGDTRCSSTYDEDDRSQRLSESELVTRRLFPEIGVVEVQQKKPKVQQNLLGKKSRRGPRSRSSQYRGVTFYRRTGRWESHIWDCGKQVYLGGFDTAHSAARAYDRAAIKFRGVDADINFNVSDYEEDMKQTVNFSKEEFVHILRRQTTGYTRGSSKYRGVTVHKCGEWEARMGQFLGKNRAYDKDAIECNRREAVTNFEASNYKGKILPTIDHGNNRDLNLSLGISTPSIGSDSSRNENIEQARLDYVHDTLRLQLENPISALKGLPLTSGHPPSWSHVYPTFVPNNEGNATNSRAMAGSSQGPPYWAWKLHDHNHIPTTAASSGFSAPAATSSSHHLRETISMAPLNNHYSPLTAATSYAQYYHQTKPPPAPPP